MWYHPAAMRLTWRDIIGGWLICAAIAIVIAILVPMCGSEATTGARPDAAQPHYLSISAEPGWRLVALC
jgi:hypothetical protein